jgi:leucine dehydrogenase
MTIKCSLGQLDAGGGKMVVWKRRGLQRAKAFEVIGRRLEELRGAFKAAGDLGTSREDLEHIALQSSHVNLDEALLTSSAARGVLRCIEHCATKDRRVASLKIAVQGCGAIGAAVARTLLAAGATVTVCDLDSSKARELAGSIGALQCSAEDFFEQDVDVLCPCAAGDVLTQSAAAGIQARAVIGAANNIMAVGDEEVEATLSSRGITFVPDTISSAGAVVAGFATWMMGLEDPLPLVDRLGDTAARVVNEARARSVPPSQVATEHAFRRIEATKQRRAAAAP